MNCKENMIKLTLYLYEWFLWWIFKLFVRVSIIIWSESHWRRRNKCFDNNFKLCSARYVPSVLKAGRFLYTGSTSNQTSSSLGWASSNSVAKLKKKKKISLSENLYTSKRILLPKSDLKGARGRGWCEISEWSKYSFLS